MNTTTVEETIVELCEVSEPDISMISDPEPFRSNLPSFDPKRHSAIAYKLALVLESVSPLLVDDESGSRFSYATAPKSGAVWGVRCKTPSFPEMLRLLGPDAKPEVREFEKFVNREGCALGGSITIALKGSIGTWNRTIDSKHPKARA